MDLLAYPTAVRFGSILFYLMISGFVFSSEKTVAPSSPLPTESSKTLSAEKVVRQREIHPVLLDKQTLYKTDSTDASFKMNAGQNLDQLPGSGFQSSQKLLPHLSAIYENNVLLPSRGESVDADRYLHQNKFSLEWAAFKSTSFRGGYTVQNEHSLEQQQGPLSETNQKELGMTGTLFKKSLWEAGYRSMETRYSFSTQETSLWYSSWQQPMTSAMSLIFQGDYSESGDPSLDWVNEEKRLGLGSAANYQINDGFSAQLRFDLKMQEEKMKNDWVAEEKRISFSLKGVF